MRVIRINTGNADSIKIGENVQQTGLFKHSHHESIWIGKDGLPNDFIGSEKHHGGPDQAVYIFTQPDYFQFEKLLGLKTTCGLFGENLDVSILESHNTLIGDILVFDQVKLEVTGPRFPCGTFSVGMNDPQFVKKFKEIGRPGLYCRVLEEGVISQGDSFEVIRYPGTQVSIADIFEDHYSKNADRQIIERFLSVPLASRIRTPLERRLLEFNN